MNNRETYQYQLLEKLSFNRFGGTEDELKAAKLLLGEIESFGGKGEIMDFTIPAYTIEKAAITVTAPFTRSIECVAKGHSGQFPEGGVELALRYVEANSPAGFLGMEDLTGCAVLVNNPLDWDMYKALWDRHAQAIIVINADKWYQDGSTTDLISLATRETFLAVGAIPTFTIRSKDANEMLRDGAETVRLELRQKSFDTTSRDVLAVVEGTESHPGEDIVLTAHYDSVTVGTGSWDNGSGAVTLMYLYEHFLNHPAKRTMRFVWCGSEEQGLYGSKAYVEKNPELVKGIRFCFNFDMNGTILGSNNLFITGGDDLKAIAEAIANEAGYPVGTVRVGIHSSDSAPFAEQGIPSVGLSRGTKAGEIHTRYDLMPLMSAEKLHYNAEFAIFFIERFVNAAVFPVKREIPENLVKEVEKYFKKDKLAQLAKERGEEK